jgi:Xaa-Pro dipeptidase
MSDPASRRDRLGGIVAAMRRAHVDALLLSRPELVWQASGARRVWTAGAQPFVPSCVVVAATQEVHVIGFNDACIPEDIPVWCRHASRWDMGALVDELHGITAMQGARVIALDGLTLRLCDAITARFGDIRLVDALPLFAA